MAKHAINAARTPYSTRSCPSLSRARRAIAARRRSIVLLRWLRTGASPRPSLSTRLRVLQLIGDVGEDRAHLRAGDLHRAERDERDQRHEQRVLEQILSRLIADERAKLADPRHDNPPETTVAVSEGRGGRAARHRPETRVYAFFSWFVMLVKIVL